jgi:putative effector of murein hydrolase LrgA (UPF0299 family)
MSEWLRRIIQALIIIIACAASVRLAWELLRPAVPALIVLLALLFVLRLLWLRSQRW